MTTTSTAVQPQDFTSFVFADGENLKTTSLIVAEKFGKLHKNVLRDIDNLLEKISNDFKRLNFERTDFIDKNGDTQRMYKMTKDGLVILVMGYTGEAAMAIKESYINAFNFMHKKLFEKPAIERPMPMTKPCHPLLFTRDQYRHIDHLIGVAAKNTEQYRQKIIKDLNAFFQTKKWFFIPRDKYNDVCAYFNVEPLFESPAPSNADMVVIPREEYEFLRKSCENPPDLAETLTEFYRQKDARQYPTETQVIIERQRLAELSVLAKVATSGHGDLFAA